jgi:hypothetical protein
VLACFNLSGLYEFNFPTSTCPNSMKFDMLLIECVLFKLEFLWNLLSCFDIDLIVIILFALMCFQSA